jgi:gas vesicle protein GvpL/GvpF
MSERRYALIGAHRQRSDAEGVPGVTLFEIAPVIVSAIAFDAEHGIAGQEVLGRALEARSALMAQATFVAIRYGASVKDGYEAAAKCASFLSRWREVLERHQDMAEITVRIAGTGKGERPDRHAFKSGSDYLRALHAARSAQIEEQTRSAVEQAFAGLAGEHRWLAREDGGAEFVALVNRRDIQAVRKAGETLQTKMRDVPFLLSGPWPLEVFAEEG